MPLRVDSAVSHFLICRTDDNEFSLEFYHWSMGYSAVCVPISKMWIFSLSFVSHSQLNYVVRDCDLYATSLKFVACFDTQIYG